ncbi:hypothetical protein PIB30_041803 [Stylosanthes scabra]|uniref:Uncharacterized protein n=1 Tax=Stylosanthes scabra TaxID=79078 RepID=A0ABU6YDV8_9FABA|nr:hypothetical protein [Stylosanthes scabra]
MGSNPTYCIVPFHRPIPETQQKETPPRFLLRRALDKPPTITARAFLHLQSDSKAEEAMTSCEASGVQGSEADGKGSCVVIEGATVLLAHSARCYDDVLNLRF